jgi:hypothetical protein
MNGALSHTHKAVHNGENEQSTKMHKFGTETHKHLRLNPEQNFGTRHYLLVAMQDWYLMLENLCTEKNLYSWDLIFPNN